MADIAPQKNQEDDRAGPGQAGAGGLGGIFALLIELFSELFGGGPNGIFNSLKNLFGNDGANDADAQFSSASEGGVSGPVNVPSDGIFSSTAALRRARTDNAGVGDCAKGVANILQSQGYNVTRGHAHDWKESLPQNGWVRLDGVNARNAPEGAVLVFDSDVNQGRTPRNRGGGRYGHVEVVCYDENGNRVYVSDKARDNVGGTVPNNFVGAYIPTERYAAMQRQQQEDRMLAERAPKSASETAMSRNTSVAAALDGGHGNGQENGQASRDFAAAANQTNQVALNSPEPSATRAVPQQDYRLG